MQESSKLPETFNEQTQEESLTKILYDGIQMCMDLRQRPYKPTLSRDAFTPSCASLGITRKTSPHTRDL